MYVEGTSVQEHTQGGGVDGVSDQNIRHNYLQWLSDSSSECTKFVLGQGSAPDSTGGAYSAPQTL